MRWDIPAIRNIYLRPGDKTVKLRNRATSNTTTDVVTIPKHVVDELRPNTFGHRIDIRFKGFVPVELPEDFAIWLLERFDKLYKTSDKPYSQEMIDALTYQQLMTKVSEMGLYKPGMKKEELVNILMAGGEV